MGTDKKGRFLSGLILAAGASRRLGQPKQLLELAGKPVLQHVIDQAARSCLRELVLVLGHRAPEIEAALRAPSDCPLSIVTNPDYAQGQSRSLQLGLQSIDPRAEAAVVLLGDQPGVVTETIDALATRFFADERPLLRPVYGASDDASAPSPGHPVFLGKQVWDEIQELRGDVGARKLFERDPDRSSEVPMPGPPPSDIDTWEDYQRILACSTASNSTAPTD